MVIIYLYCLDNDLAQIPSYLLIIDLTQAIGGSFQVRDDISLYNIDRQQNTEVRMINVTTSQNKSLTVKQVLEQLKGNILGYDISRTGKSCV